MYKKNHPNELLFSYQLKKQIACDIFLVCLHLVKVQQYLDNLMVMKEKKNQIKSIINDSQTFKS